MRPHGRVIRIGRAPDNDVVLDYEMVSAHHARITVGLDGQASIEDLGSTNGTAVNRPECKSKRAPLSIRDTVYFGSLPVAANGLLLEGAKRGAESVPVGLGGKTMVFGRDPDCDQVLNYPMISWRHAQLTSGREGLVLEDLRSTNGTFVNGQRISRVEVGPGDVIGLGSYTFTLTDTGQLQKRDYRGNVTIEARRVSVAVSGRRLIEDVSLTIFPCEFVGLMGPSGAGKTTLMNVLNGYSRPTAGDVFLNGQSLSGNYAQFARHIGYVPQDDIIHRDLTVGQARYYTARLRLPRDFSDADIHQRIREVLRQLELEGTEDVLVGSPEKRGISGGQRKRVNLAMELLTDPLVLFLDEPTSGLSSEDALTVMRLVRGLAYSGKTILMTIHQPGLEVYRQLDNLALLSRDGTSPGRLAYYGPAFPDAVLFFNAGAWDPGTSGQRCAECPANVPSPDEILCGLKRRTTEEWCRLFNQSKYRRDYVDARAGRQRESAPAARASPPRSLFPIGQTWTLLCRTLAMKVRDRWNTGILLAQAPVIALLICIGLGTQLRAGPGEPATDFEQHQLFPGAVAAALFLLVLAGLWFGCSNAVREIVGEWAIYRRERMVNLSIPAYVASKFLVLGGLGVMQCAVLLGITHAGCGLQASWPALYAILLLATLTGTALGLTLSAAARSSEMAIALLPVFLLPLVMFSGVMIRIHNLGLVGKGICSIAASRWAFEGMMVLESDARGACMTNVSRQPSRPARELEGKAEIASGGDNKIDVAEGWFPQQHQNSDKNHRVRPKTCVAVLGGMMVALMVAVAVILQMRDVY
jgi:ABC-type multidrug transport system ATPase subunit